jgi:hypothetical protein
MAHLTLAGLSDDGKRLLLVSDKGVEFTLDIDVRLRAALRGEHARLGHLEIQMDSALRPRDIQARIRAGDTPEAVAQAAQTTVDRIMAFAAPVLAERQHVAERAQRSSVRRKPGESASGARTLGDAVAGHLRSMNVDPDTVSWDARRREDGRWTLTGDYVAGKRQGSATFIYDPPGNYVTVEDEDARWLLGEQVASPRPPRDDLKQARGRRLSAVPHEELPLGEATSSDDSALGDDAIEMVSGEPGSLGAEQPLEAYLDDERPTRETPAVEESADEPTDEPAVDREPAAREEPPAPAEEEPPARKPKRKGRASVPSWDEIMFGGGKND